MSQGPESQAPPAPPADEISPPRAPIPSRNAAASVFSNAVLMLFGGLLAGGGYFLARVYAPPRPPGEVTGPASAGVQPDEFKALAARVDALKGQVDEASKKGTDTPGPDPDFKKLRDQVDDLARSVGGLPVRFDMVEKRIDADAKAQAVAPSPRFDALDKRVVDLAQVVDALKSDAGARPKSAAATPTPASGKPEDRTIEQAVSLFKEAKYAEAEAAFARLQATSADDARVWYFSALARGLATRQWSGETERLVLAGLEREKAGSPPTAQVDTAFNGLTAATGKDWLAAYRKRIAAR